MYYYGCDIVIIISSSNSISNDIVGEIVWHEQEHQVSDITNVPLVIPLCVVEWRAKVSRRLLYYGCTHFYIKIRRLVHPSKKTWGWTLHSWPCKDFPFSFSAVSPTIYDAVIVVVCYVSTNFDTVKCLAFLLFSSSKAVCWKVREGI